MAGTRGAKAGDDGKGRARAAARQGTVASAADLLPAVPFTVMMKTGELYLSGGRLRFTVGVDVRLDAPVAELHSLAPAVMGIHIWHGPKRYRFALGNRDRRSPLAEQSAAVTAMWMDALQPLVGSAPAGVTVRTPWPRWAWILSVVALTAFFIAAAFVIVRIKN
ncbi:MAG: hypothetical protein JWN39_4443 [Ilumatobacteraceae bacterium]|nr:hypothetical protein [Ilumatobacteraceae bacterium]